MSAESGLKTFRDENGLWEGHDVMEVASPQGFARNPELVLEFYNQRRRQLLEVSPNAGHRALAKLEQEFTGEVIIVTQNVDGLHERAGSQNVMHMHGFLEGALCAGCGHRWPAPLNMKITDRCPKCKEVATRPDIVWFGEMPYDMEDIWDHLRSCDYFVSVGTSGNVCPATAFVQDAARHGAITIELNLEPSAVVSDFAESHCGKASDIVPEWVEKMLSVRK